MYALLVISFLIIFLFYFIYVKRTREKFSKSFKKMMDGSNNGSNLSSTFGQINVGKMVSTSSIKNKKKKKEKETTPVIEEPIDSNGRIAGVDNESYFEDIKYELKDQWKANFDNIYEFKTSDDKYTCMFMNSANLKNVPFIRTIVPEEYNDVYSLNTTQCAETAEEGECNTDGSKNIEGKLFYEDVDNVDYSVNRNKVFLHTDDGYTYADFDKVSDDEVNMTYRTTYEICKPDSSGNSLTANYDFTRGFDQLFPCGYVQCTTDSTDDARTSLETSVTEKHKEILKEEHQSKIDEILQSLGFTTWIKALKTIQNRNQTISEMCDSVGTEENTECQTGEDAYNTINNIMTADDDLEPIESQ